MYKTGPMESVEDVDAFCRGTPGSFEAAELDLSGTQVFDRQVLLFREMLGIILP